MFLFLLLCARQRNLEGSIYIVCVCAVRIFIVHTVSNHKNGIPIKIAHIAVGAGASGSDGVGGGGVIANVVICCLSYRSSHPNGIHFTGIQ